MTWKRDWERGGVCMADRLEMTQRELRPAPGAQLSKASIIHRHQLAPSPLTH